MQVENWNIDDVKPYENNPRNNDEAVEYVANSIREFGFQQPLVVDSDGVLIVGHTRLKAAKELGLESVPVVVASDLTDEQVRAYRLADNKVAEASSWDWNMLNEELENIDWLDLNMEKFGFKDLEINYDPDVIFGQEGGADSKETKEKVNVCPKCGHEFV